MSGPEVLISAGEPSGEMYAALLAAALGRRAGVHLFGLGGPAMRQAGVELLADADRISVVGISEALGRLPAAWKSLRLLAAESARRRPRLAILVDFPDFNLRLARRLHRQGVPIVYFISPQVWAWRSGRVKLIRQLVQRMLVIFPFEEKFYREAGVPVSYIGHPLVDSVRPRESRAQFLSHHGLDPARPVVALLPGSRPAEVAHNLPPILDACRLLAGPPSPQFVLTAAPSLRSSDFAPHLRPDLPLLAVEGATYDALAASDCALISSGTATVEAALLGVPMVVVYRVSRATALIARRLIRSPFLSMVNLILGRPAVPELIQEDFTPESVAKELRRLLGSAEARARMQRDLAEVRERLRPPSPGGAIERAAEIVAALISGTPEQLPRESLLS